MLVRGGLAKNAWSKGPRGVFSKMGSITDTPNMVFCAHYSLFNAGHKDIKEGEGIRA